MTRSIFCLTINAILLCSVMTYAAGIGKKDSGEAIPRAHFAGRSLNFAGNSDPVLVARVLTAGACELLLANLDKLFSELIGNPNHQGYIVITPDTNGRGYRSRERQSRAWIKYHAMDPSRFTIVRAKETPGGMTELWRVPPDADSTILVRNAETDPLPTKSDHPYILATRSFGGIVGCDDFDLSEYAQILKENTSFRGNLVIGSPTRRNFQAETLFIVAKLMELGVPSSRLKTFFKKIRSGNEFIEIWVVPPRKS